MFEKRVGCVSIKEALDLIVDTRLPTFARSVFVWYGPGAEANL
jgi:hypothetical protein